MTDAAQMRLTEAERYYRKPALAQEHSETSKAAARAIEPKRPTKRARILKLIRQYGGLTADELEVMTTWRGDTVRPRLVELREMGLIRDSGVTRPTRAGHEAAVWMCS